MTAAVVPPATVPSEAVTGDPPTAIVCEIEAGRVGEGDGEGDGDGVGDAEGEAPGEAPLEAPADGTVVGADDGTAGVGIVDFAPPPHPATSAANTIETAARTPACCDTLTSSVSSIDGANFTRRTAR